MYVIVHSLILLHEPMVGLDPRVSFCSFEFYKITLQLRRAEEYEDDGVRLSGL